MLSHKPRKRLNFHGEAELRFRWQYQDRIHVVLDLTFNEVLADPTEEDEANQLVLEQAHVLWQANPQATIGLGRLSTWLGWEAPDPDARWRIHSAFEWTNHEQAVLPFAYPYRRLMYGIEHETGLWWQQQLGDYHITGYVVDEIWVPKENKDGTDLGYGIEISRHSELLSITLEGSYETGTRKDGTKDDFGLILHGAWRASEYLQVAAEVALFDYYYDQAIGGFITATYDVEKTWQPTLQLSWMDIGDLPNVLSGAVYGDGNFVRETDFTEIAASVFYYPVPLNAKIRLGIETGYQIAGDRAIDDVWYATVQFLSVL